MLRQQQHKTEEIAGPLGAGEIASGVLEEAAEFQRGTTAALLHQLVSKRKPELVILTVPLTILVCWSLLIVVVAALTEIL